MNKNDAKFPLKGRRRRPDRRALPLLQDRVEQSLRSGQVHHLRWSPVWEGHQVRSLAVPSFFSFCCISLVWTLWFYDSTVFYVLSIRTKHTQYTGCVCVCIRVYVGMCFCVSVQPTFPLSSSYASRAVDISLPLLLHRRCGRIHGLYKTYSQSIKIVFSTNESGKRIGFDCTISCLRESSLWRCLR